MDSLHLTTCSRYLSNSIRFLFFVSFRFVFVSFSLSFSFRFIFVFVSFRFRFVLVFRFSFFVSFSFRFVFRFSFFVFRFFVSLNPGKSWNRRLACAPPAPSRNSGGCKSLCDWCSYLVALLFNCPKLKLTSWQQGACSTQTANIQKRSWGSHPRSRQERQTRQEEQDKPGQGESWQGKAKESKT